MFFAHSLQVAIVDGEKYGGKKGIPRVYYLRIPRVYYLSRNLWKLRACVARRSFLSRTPGYCCIM